MLVNDLVDMSRLQTDKLTLHLEECDLRALVGSTVDMAQSLAGGPIHVALPREPRP